MSHVTSILFLKIDAETKYLSVDLAAGGCLAAKNGWHEAAANPFG
jgi:hypothetical protein